MKQKAGAKKTGKAGVFLDVICSIVIYLIIAALVLVLAGQARRFHDFGYSVFVQKAKDAPADAVSASVTIESGMTARTIADELYRDGLIDDAELFIYQARFSDYAGSMRPGTYTLSSDMTANQMLAVMSGAEVSDTADTQ